MLVRNRSTGAVITEDDFRALHPNTSFPAQLTPEILSAFDYDPVLEGAQPTGEPWQFPVADGVEQIEGLWFTKWKLGPEFASPEEEAAYIAGWQAQQAELFKNEVVLAAQKQLDDFARTRNYDGVLSAATYATSPDPVFSAEGQYCVVIRDDTWNMLYQILEEVQSGTRPPPTSVEEVLALLPVPEWPV